LKECSPVTIFRPEPNTSSTYFGNTQTLRNYSGPKYTYTYNHHRLYVLLPSYTTAAGDSNAGSSILTKDRRFKHYTKASQTRYFQEHNNYRAVFPCQTASECRGSVQLINTCVRTRAFVLAMTLKLGHERYATRDVRRACEPTRGACAATRVVDDRRRVTWLPNKFRDIGAVVPEASSGSEDQDSVPVAKTSLARR